MGKELEQLQSQVTTLTKAVTALVNEKTKSSSKYFGAESEDEDCNDEEDEDVEVAQVKGSDVKFIASEIKRKNGLIDNPDKQYVSGKKVSAKFYALKKKTGKWVTMRVGGSGHLYHPKNCLFTYNGRKLHTRN